MIVSLKLVLLAVIFVATSGSLFMSVFRGNKFLVALAAIVGLVSSFYLARSIYDDVNIVQEYQNDDVKNDAQREILADSTTSSAVEARPANPIIIEQPRSLVDSLSLEDVERWFINEIGDRIFFDSDDFNLTLEAQKTANKWANWLVSNPKYAAILEGHTDERGDYEYNAALGARMANSTRRWLVSNGVPAERLRAVTYGESRPVALCSSMSCFDQNRRVVIVLTELGK